MDIGASGLEVSYVGVLHERRHWFIRAGSMEGDFVSKNSGKHTFLPSAPAAQVGVKAMGVVPLHEAAVPQCLAASDPRCVTSGAFLCADACWAVGLPCLQAGLGEPFLRESNHGKKRKRAGATPMSQLGGPGTDITEMSLSKYPWPGLLVKGIVIQGCRKRWRGNPLHFMPSWVSVGWPGRHRPAAKQGRLPIAGGEKPIQFSGSEEPRMVSGTRIVLPFLFISCWPEPRMAPQMLRITEWESLRQRAARPSWGRV